MPRNITTPATCRRCGAGFLARKSEVQAGRGLYCSPACQYARVPQVALSDEADPTVALIPVYGHGRVVAYAKVDRGDSEWACRYRWHLSKGYARRAERRAGTVIAFFMHRELLGLVKGDRLAGDHISRDTLDNRRGNLRILTKATNGQNRTSKRGTASAFRGVSWNAEYQRWYATMTANAKTTWLGSFADEEAAAKAARDARRRLLPFSPD